MKRLQGLTKKNPVLNNTWVLSFPDGIHPKDFKLKGVFLFNKNVMTKHMTWNSFDSICMTNYNGSKIDAVGRVGKMNYFLVFKR